MTDQELKDYYADLLILQYKGKPKAYATIQALAELEIRNQLPIQIQDAFGLETAFGVQLDIVGKYAGVSRNVYTFTQYIVLSDDDFRLLIKIKIIQNNSGSSLYDIQNLLHQFFPGSLIVFDYQNMHMDYFFDAAVGSQNLAEAFVANGLLPKPMGVELGALIYAFNIDSFFGFRTYELPGFNVDGFNFYDNYSLTIPWLSYVNAIVP